MWKTLPKKLMQKLSEWLYLNSLNHLAARIVIANKNPSPSSLFMEQSFVASHSSKDELLKTAKKHKQTTSIYTFISTEFLFSRHMTNPLSLIFDFKLGIRMKLLDNLLMFIYFTSATCGLKTWSGGCNNQLRLHAMIAAKQFIFALSSSG